MTSPDLLTLTLVAVEQQFNVNDDYQLLNDAIK